MGKRILQVRKWLVIDAIILLALSAYELITRVDAMWGPLKMFVNLAVGEGVPLKRAAAYVEVAIFEAPAYMLMCIVLSLLVILTIRKMRSSYVLMPLSLAMFAWGLFVQMTLLGELIRYAKVLPLLLMSILLTVQIFLVRAQRRALRAQARRVGYSAGYAPLPTQRMEGRRFQYGIGEHPKRLPRRRRAS
ncbi:MAG: hypothetical protein II343_00370 [Clostridia bacterium]|nr:hypothetical protein [Clostridia bacterium]